MRHLKTTSSSFWQTGLTTTTRLHVLSTQRLFVDVTLRPLTWCCSLSRQVPRLTKSGFWKPIGPFCWASAYFLLDSFLLFRDPYLELIHVQVFFSQDAICPCIFSFHICAELVDSGKYFFFSLLANRRRAWRVFDSYPAPNQKPGWLHFRVLLTWGWRNENTSRC